jgi:hypothetical protein
MRIRARAEELYKNKSKELLHRAPRGIQRDTEKSFLRIRARAEELLLKEVLSDKYVITVVYALCS